MPCSLIHRAIDHREARSRERFVDVLAQFMAAMPDPEAIKAFAEKHPDRWTQAVAVFGRLAGFQDKAHLESSVAVDVARMSDAELMDKLVETQARFKALEPESG